MKHAIPDVEYRLADLQGQVYAACRMGAWAFDDNKHLFKSTAPHEEEYHMLLRAGGALQLAIDRKGEEPVLRIISGNLGLGWVAEWVYLPTGGEILVILGPVYLKNTALEQSLQGLDRLGISQHLRRQFYNVLGDVPVLSFEMLRQYACILHYTCYQESCSPLVAAPPKNDAAEKSSEEEELSANSNDYQRMAEYEEMLLHHLAEGTAPPEGPNRYPGELQNFNMKDPARVIKDNLLNFTGLCSRTVIKSGVSVYAARTTENEWVKRIEAATTFSELKKLREGMYSAFLRQVRQQKDSGGFSRAVQECRGYIQANYTQDLTLEEIARHCGYAEYYLSRKFTKETGMKLGDYIHTVRIDAAKIMLITTRKEIQEISDSLHFGNRNHFDRVFRQLVGVSPAKYRELGSRLVQKENS